MPTIAVRPATPLDEIFLYELYSAVRGPEFAQAPITATQREHLIRMQFHASMSAYAQMFPNSCYHLVLLDARPIGRLWVWQGNGEFHLVDIAIHPSVQSKGIGTVLIQRLQQEAAKLGLPVRCSVSRFNPRSLRFHQKLGFTITRTDEMNLYLEWRSPALF